jgi:hypothetical protein
MRLVATSIGKRLSARGFVTSHGGSTTACQQHSMLTACSAVPFVQAPDGVPVWRQLLQCLLKHTDPVVAQQAGAALAE